jgi:hypothetical protein
MVAAAIVGSAVVGAAGASKSSKAQNRATDAASDISWEELAMAREQWEFQKNIYLPKAMQQADEQLMLGKALAANQLKDSELYRSLASDSFDQAKKSWKYQDQFMDMTDEYTSGRMGNRMADEANADVEQAYEGGLKTMMRGAQRYGINPGSGEFASQMGDMALQHSADKAGAQTMARNAARAKAEMMVATAAGSGQAGFGTGLQAGALATGASQGAAATGAAGLNGLNSVANTFGAGARTSMSSGAAGTFGRLATTGRSDPLTDYLSGALSGVAKGGLKTPSYNYGAGSNPGLGVPVDQSGNGWW